MDRIWIGDFRCKPIQQIDKQASEQAKSDDNSKNNTNESSSFIKNQFIIDDLATHSWFATDAFYKLEKTLSSSTDIIIMLGLLDCINSCTWDIFDIETIATDYANSINELIKGYTGCNFYVCAIGPVNGDYSSSIVDTEIISAKTINKKIELFNKKVKELCEEATFVDVYNYLIKTGYSTYDGIHYKHETSIAIQKFIEGHILVVGGGNFTPRLTAPIMNSADGVDPASQYWLGDSYGGLNPFDNLGQKYYRCTGDTLPNCTSYAWGRFYEIIGTRPTLSTSNAEDWYLYTSDGYERGQTPRLGAIACWQKGAIGDDPSVPGSDAGHVAIVEKINSDGSLLLSESGWDCEWYWHNYKVSKDSSGGYDYGSYYKFQGFIYAPTIKTSGGVADYVPKSKVTSGNFWIAHKSDEMKLNARYIWQYLGNKGWSLNAVAGLLGNLQAESRINPGIWQSLREGGDPDGHGYGLVQWTPYTKYTNWCTENGYDKADMDTALIRIEYEIERGLQWITRSPYNISFKEFTTSTKDPYWLGCAFLINYERPADQSQAVKDYRGGNAEYWYEYLLPYAPGLAPSLFLGGLRVSELDITSAKLSCVARNASKITYKLVNTDNKAITGTMAKEKIKLTDDDNSDKPNEGELELLFFDYSTKLKPNCTYKLTVEVSDDSDTKNDTVIFTTPQSFPDTVTSIKLVQNDTKLPTERFILKATPISNWGYWGKPTGGGYTVQLLVNGKLTKEKSISTLTKETSFNIYDYFKYQPKLGDMIQVGIRTWVNDDKNTKLFDSAHVKTSNPICMLRKPVIPYLDTNLDTDYIS